MSSRIESSNLFPSANLLENKEKITKRPPGRFSLFVQTDNGTHFTDPTGDGWTPQDIKAMRSEGMLFRCHSFEAACADLDIEHRLIKPRHPWTNGQIERMNRTIKEAMARRFYYETHDHLRQHLTDFVVASRLCAGSPHMNLFANSGKKPSQFIQNPHHQILGLNI